MSNENLNARHGDDELEAYLKVPLAATNIDPLLWWN
jgi:hypothetical protein